MGTFQPVWDIVLQYFVITVCAKQNIANIIYFSFFFKLVCNFEILALFHVNSVFYIFSSTCTLGFSQDVQ